MRLLVIYNHNKRYGGAFMNKAMIYKYCEVHAENGDMILFSDGCAPYMTAQNLKTGEMWSCDSLEQFEMLCEMQ